MRLTILFLCLMVISCTTFNSSLKTRKVANDDTSMQLPEEIDGEEAFQYIKDLIRENNVKSVDTFLSLLPENYRTRHVLMFDTGSLQGASYENPRVILYTPQSKLVMTFNGDPSQRGYESLETMRFTKRNGKPQFIFEEITFEDDFEKRRDHINYKNGTPQELKDLLDRKNRTGPNPVTCVGCHRANPRPNWEPYNVWLNAYGQFDDRPFVKTNSSDPSGHPALGQVASYNEEPARKLPLFLESASKKNRYKHLLDLNEHQNLNPRDADQGNDRRTVKMFLANFTHEISQLNFQRIVQMIQDSGDSKNAVRLLLSAWDCPTGQSPTSRYQSYALIKKHFENTTVPWEEFFMNFIRAPDNRWTSSLNAAASMSYLVVQKFPELKDQFTLRASPSSFFMRIGEAYPKDYLTAPDKNGLVYRQPQIAIPKMCKNLDEMLK